MYGLAFVTVIAGLILIGLGMLLLLLPGRALAWLARFPRDIAAGRILTTLAMAWAVWMLLHARINWVDEHRNLVWMLAPAAWLLIIMFMDELLAVRALGGLLLLAPMPILDAAFLEATPWRLVMVTLAYLLVIAGMVLVWSPYKFRTTVARRLATPARCRAWGGAGLLCGLALDVLALTAF